MSKQTVDTLEFEKNIIEVEEKIKNIKKLEETDGIKLDAEVSRLQSKLEKLLKIMLIVKSIIVLIYLLVMEEKVS